MQPRTELGISAGLLLVLGVVVVAAASRRGAPAVDDARRSTYLTGPGGASAFAEAAARLGVEVVRYRRPIGTLTVADSGSGKAVVAVLGPGSPLGSSDARHLLELPADLLLAGPGARAAMECLGYRLDRRIWRDSIRTRSPADAEDMPAPKVATALVPHGSREVRDNAARYDGRSVRCRVPQPSRVDTLLETMRQSPVVVRLSYPSGRSATLVADDGLFRNRTLRRTLAGGLTVGLVAGRYQRMIVDEYHHGYTAAGSLGGAALDWSARSPWGWMVWQLAAVGLVALVASGVRFGPVRSAIERRRRSPMEHVRALATALAAARGHDVAVRLMVQGLRRRLSRGGRPGSADLGAWLESLGPSVRTSRGREALATLSRTLGTAADASAVLAAGNAVETLWEELKPT
jgi:hypothetical protein